MFKLTIFINLNLIYLIHCEIRTDLMALKETEIQREREGESERKRGTQQEFVFNA